MTPLERKASEIFEAMEKAPCDRCGELRPWATLMPYRKDEPDLICGKCAMEKMDNAEKAFKLFFGGNRKDKKKARKKK